jgi:hypothetical protein
VTLGTPVKIRGKWTGGTGKYTGLQGEFDIAPTAPITTDGPTQGAGKKLGIYKIIK